MNIAIAVSFCLLLLIVLVILQVLARLRHERTRKANLDAHLQMLSEGIERIAESGKAAADDPDAYPSVQSVRDPWGSPPRQAAVLEEIRPANGLYPDWDYVIHLHEGVEQYLGTAQFRGLEGRFAGIPGVDDCRQEDREVFLIRTKQLSLESLREAIWREFLESAGTS